MCVMCGVRVPMYMLQMINHDFLTRDDDVDRCYYCCCCVRILFFPICWCCTYYTKNQICLHNILWLGRDYDDGYRFPTTRNNRHSARLTALLQCFT